LPGYYNLFPSEFGLGYDIFAFPNGTELQKRSPLPFNALHDRQAQGATKVAGQCYADCNNCMLEAESTGKTAALCSSGSAFETALSDCKQCIQNHPSGSTTSGSLPEFQQFLSFCTNLQSGVQQAENAGTSSVGSGSGANGNQASASQGSAPSSAGNGNQGSAPSSTGNGNQGSAPSSTGNPGPAPSNAGNQGSASGNGGNQGPAPTATQNNSQGPNPSTNQSGGEASGSSNAGAGATVPSKTSPSSSLFTGAGSPSVITLPHSWLFCIFSLVSLLNILI